MRIWRIWGAGLVACTALAPHVGAQPVTAPAAGPGPASVPVAATAVPPPGLHVFLGLTHEQKEAKRRKCCQMPAGQLLNQLLRPVSVFTGGVLGNYCPQTPSAADLAQPGVFGVCAKIRLDAAQAKARRAAVRCLGEVDCRRMPEVAVQLIGTMRTDLNECVRAEAAMVLGNGCCCTKAVIEALVIVATGSGKDNLPPEKCERVRLAALDSLHHCLACYSEEVPAEKKPEKKPEPLPDKIPEPVKVPEPPRAQLDGGLRQMAYYETLESKPLAQTIEEARRALADTKTVSVTTFVPTGSHSLASIWKSSVQPASHISEDSTLHASRPVEKTNEAPRPMATAKAKPTAAPAPSANLDKWILALQTSASLAERESAADKLASVDAQTHPEILSVLANAACGDLAPTVRVHCIHALLKLGLPTPAVLRALEQLRDDGNPQVAHEADEARRQIAQPQLQLISATDPDGQ